VQFLKHALLFLWIWGCLSSAGHAQEKPRFLAKKITVSLHSVFLEDALNDIGTKAECYFSYNDAVINKKQIVSAQAENASVASILQQCLRDTTLRFREIDNQIIIFRPRKPHAIPVISTEEIPAPKQEPTITEIIEVHYTVPIDTVRDTLTAIIQDTVWAYDTVIVSDTVTIHRQEQEIPSRKNSIAVSALYGANFYRIVQPGSFSLGDKQEKGTVACFAVEGLFPFRKRGIVGVGIGLSATDYRNAFSRTVQLSNQVSTTSYEPFIVDEYTEHKPNGDSIVHTVYDSVATTITETVTQDSVIEHDVLLSYTQLCILVDIGAEIIKTEHIACSATIGIIPTLAIEKKGEIVYEHGAEIALRHATQTIQSGMLYGAASLSCDYLFAKTFYAGLSVQYQHSLHNIFSTGTDFSAMEWRTLGGIRLGITF